MTTHPLSRLPWTAVLCAIALVLTSCSSSDDGDSEDSATGDQVLFTTGLVNVEDAGDPVQGGTLTVAELSETRSLDTTETYGTGATGLNVMAAVYDTLMRYDNDSKSFEPRLAESLESDDNMTWTLTLRDGVSFTDGTPLDGDAVVASLEYYIANYGYKGDIIDANLKSMEATDERTVTFTFNIPWATFPNMMASGPGLIMAPAAYKDPDKFRPIGAGPFTFKSQSAGEKLVLVANEDYFDGRPNLDTIEFVLMNTDKAQYESLESGVVDVVYVREGDVAQKAFDSGLPGAVTALSQWRTLNLNAREGSPTSDVRLRQAIALAIDPETWMQRFNGDADRANSKLMDPFSEWNTDVPGVEPDLEAARKLVEEAKADGFDGKIGYVAPADAQSQVGGVTTKAMLDSVGFDVKLDLMNSITDQVQRIYVDGDFDISSGSNSVLDNDPYTALYSPLDSASDSNPGRYANPKMDELLTELAAAASPDDGLETMSKIEELWKEDVPFLNISGGSYYNIWGKDVHGIQPTTETSILLDEAWIE